MKVTLAALAALTVSALALSSGAFAETRSAPPPAAPHFNVIEADARVPFSNVRVNGFEIGRDNSIIFDAGPNHWYRATVWTSCAHDLRWASEHIALDTRPDGTLDRFSTIIVRGRHCPIESLDRIERPARGATY